MYTPTTVVWAYDQMKKESKRSAKAKRVSFNTLSGRALTLVAFHAWQEACRASWEERLAS